MYNVWIPIFFPVLITSVMKLKECYEIFECSSVINQVKTDDHDYICFFFNARAYRYRLRIH